jgi:2-octaprenyl-3-methyl-6-methoxy-1,4-benzoquinol hydroxylase/2-octaprenylphenol hydroxylase
MNRRASHHEPIHDVAIVGAGMVGAALALKLAQGGFDVALVESRAPPPWRADADVDLRVVALAASSVDLLDAIGMWPAIAAARACPYRRMHVWDALAPGALTFDAAADARAALGYIVENRLIQHVLWQAITVDARISLRCPARVAATQADGDRRTLEFDDGSRLDARLVVGADGGDSALRELAGIATRERDYAQRAVVAHVVTERAHEFTAWQRFAPQATLALLPLADGIAAAGNDQERDASTRGRRSSLVWSLADAEAARVLALDDAAFRDELGAAFDFRLGRIVHTTPRAGFALRLKLAERYLAPRLALVGDAAHVVHPLAGQGVNLGLRDVVELASVLQHARAARRDFAAEQALRAYERRRRSDNVLSGHAFDAIQRVFGSEVLPVAALRGAALGIVDRLTPLKRLFARHAAGR